MDRLGHAVEDCDTLAAAAGRERFVRYAKAAVNILPVVHDPDVARRVDGEIGLHLQAATDIPAGRRYLIAGLHAGRTVLGAGAAKLHDWAVCGGEVRDPHIVIAVDGRGPG